MNVPATGAVTNKPVHWAAGVEAPQAAVVDEAIPLICVDDDVAFNCVELNAVPAVMAAGAGQLMVGVSGHPQGSQEYGFRRFNVVHGAHAPPVPVVLSLRVNVTASGSVCPDPCTPLVVWKPGNPGLPAPGFGTPTP